MEWNKWKNEKGVIGMNGNYASLDIYFLCSSDTETHAVSHIQKIKKYLKSIEYEDNI